VSEPASGDTGAGIVQSLRNLAATLVALLRDRFELLATEIEEERIRLLELLFWAAGALFFLAVGVLLLVVLLVAVFWDSHRIVAIVVLAGLFLAAGAGMAVAVRNRMHVRPKIFSASLDELARDKDQLTSR
jgi:uncharacterized membrane protein YqjE